MNNTERLNAWIEESGLKLGHVAKKIGCGESALYAWRIGRYPPHTIFRRSIEALTNGAVPADGWEE